MDKFTEEQLKQLGELLDKKHEDKCEFCMNSERRQQHRQDHEFIRSLNATLDKFQGIKWTVLRNLLSAIVVAGTLAIVAFIWSIVRN